MPFKINRDKSNRHVAVTPWEKYQSQEAQRVQKKAGPSAANRCEITTVETAKTTPTSPTNGAVDWNFCGNLVDQWLFCESAEPYWAGDSQRQSGDVQKTSA